MIDNFCDAIKYSTKPLLLDGALGTYLMNKIEFKNSSLWTSGLDERTILKLEEVHKEYVESGSDIITTNTFRTNPSAVKNSGLNINFRELVKLNVSAAKKAIARDKKIFIAGSNAPAEDCYQRQRTLSQKEIEENHALHIEALMENGVDFILNETQSHIDEIKFICKFCRKNKIPYILSLYFDQDFNLLSGEHIYEAIELALMNDVIAIGFNCVSLDLFEKFKITYDFNFFYGFYLNCGIGNFEEGKIRDSLDPVFVSKIVSNYIKEKNLKFVGTCCGSSPSHTKELRNLIDGLP